MNEIKPGETVVANITKHLSYEVTHDGWGLTIKCTNPALNVTVGYMPDGRLSIGCSGPVKDDEV